MKNDSTVTNEIAEIRRMLLTASNKMQGLANVAHDREDPRARTLGEVEETIDRIRMTLFDIQKP